jgi:predicted RNA binding protein YcfA (HicA-like mRNA interferase family)
MSHRLPSFKPRDLVALLKRAGFTEEYQDSSHLYLRHPETRRTTCVPSTPATSSETSREKSSSKIPGFHNHRSVNFSSTLRTMPTSASFSFNARSRNCNATSATFVACLIACLSAFAPSLAAADQPPSTSVGSKPTLTDLWNGNAAWTPDTDKIGAAFGFHFISILPDNGNLYAYYIQNRTAPDGKLNITVGRAHGTDGVNWTDDGTVLDVGPARPSTNPIPPSWDDRLASFPAIWKDGDTWYLVYEGASEDPKTSPGDIGLATSTDGKTFVKHRHNPILRHNPGGWERANIGTPSLYKEAGTWYLFYHGYDGNVCQIGVATGTSLTDLTKSPANPILPVTPGASAWDTGTTGHRSRIVKEGIYYYCAFEGSTLPPFENAKWSSGLARTTNLTGPWTKFPGNPMIPQTAIGMNYDGPELLRLNETWYLYIRHVDPDHGNATMRFRLEWLRENTKS